MDGQFWSWLLTVVGLAGFFLAGKKVWWAWYVNIANQILWFTYAVITEQWGFLAGTFAYMFVFVKNAISWTKEHFETKKSFGHDENNPIGRITGIEALPDGSLKYHGKLYSKEDDS